MKKRHAKIVKSSGVGPGAIVSVKNDYRDISHAHGTIGVVTDCTKSGGVKICTQWGVITQGVAHRDYWIPMARYVVKFKSDEEAAIDDALEEMRRQVLDSTFNEVGHSRITLQEYHRNLVGATPNGRKSCRCSGGNCTARCGCWNKSPCASSCTCNGNCANPKNWGGDVSMK